MLHRENFIFQEVKSRNSHIRNYAYDADEELWCEVTLQVSYSGGVWGKFYNSPLVHSKETMCLIFTFSNILIWMYTQTPDMWINVIIPVKSLGEEIKIFLRNSCFILSRKFFAQTWQHSIMHLMSLSLELSKFCCQGSSDNIPCYKVFWVLIYQASVKNWDNLLCLRPVKIGLVL